MYIALASIQGANGTCWPKLDMIAFRAGVQPHQVSEATNLLEEKGWISKKTRHETQDSNGYEVYTEASLPESGNDIITQNGYFPLYNIKNNKSLNPKRVKRGKNYTEEFNEIWDLYPHNPSGKSKRKGSDAYEALVTSGISTEELKRAVVAYADSRAGKDRQYNIGMQRFFGEDEVWREWVKKEEEKRPTCEVCGTYVKQGERRCSLHERD